MPIRRSRYSAACARETRLSPPRCCSTVKSRRVPNSDSKVRRVRPAKSLPGALRRNSCAHLGSYFLQATAGRSLSRRGQQLRPGDYPMARPRGRRGGTAGHHPHRSADERVDNPHTKPFAFWAWLIDEVHQRDRDVIFLAEAFTKRSVMRHLGKLGFTQSYTYFTWKNARWELIEYVSELAYSGEQDYFRPNFFANTPDILHEYLQHGGRPAFEARAVLAATLSPSYGIYSGYEQFENLAVREGSEEYLHSEKYEIRQRTLDGPLLPLIGRLNAVRRETRALQELSNIPFLKTANDALIAYAKQSAGNAVIVVVNVAPHQAQEGLTLIPASLGLPPISTIRDLLSDERYPWRIGPNYVRLEPGVRQAHVLRVEI